MRKKGFEARTFGGDKHKDGNRKQGVLEMKSESYSPGAWQDALQDGSKSYLFPDKAKLGNMNAQILHLTLEDLSLLEPHERSSIQMSTPEALLPIEGFCLALSHSLALAYDSRPRLLFEGVSFLDSRFAGNIS